MPLIPILVSPLYSISWLVTHSPRIGGVGLVTCSLSASTYIHLFVSPRGPSLTSALCIPTAPYVPTFLCLSCSVARVAYLQFLLTSLPALSSIAYSHARVGWRMNLRWRVPDSLSSSSPLLGPKKSCLIFV